MKIISTCTLCDVHSLHVIGEPGSQIMQCLNCGYVSSDKYLLEDNQPIDQHAEYKKLPEKIKQSGNWMVIKSRNIKHFYLNDTKDKKDIIIKLSPAINSVMNLYLKYHDNREWLLYNSRGAKMNSNSLTKFLQN